MNLKSSNAPWIVVATLLVVTIMAGGVGYWLGHRKPSSSREQESYTIGSQFGKSLSAQNLDLDSAMVARGIADAIDNHKTALSDDEMQTAMVKLNQDRRKEADEQAAKNKIESEAFLARNRVAEGVQSTKSGLQYKILLEGKGASPKADDMVVVNFRGTLIDGKEFDSSLKRGVPAEFPVKGVMPGFQEGLKLMKKGGKSIIYVPPELGYGDRGRQNIPANGVLIFEVEMIDVKPTPTTPPAHKK